MNRMLILVMWISLIACSILNPLNEPTPTLEPTPTPTPEPCLDEAAHFIERAPILLKEWQNAYDAARSASLLELPKKIQELQRIREEFENLLPAGCRRDAEALYQDSIQFMDEIIKGLGDLSNGDLGPEAQDYLEAAEDYLKGIMDSLGMPQAEQ